MSSTRTRWPGLHQRLGQVAADEPGAAGDENLHARCFSMMLGIRKSPQSGPVSRILSRPALGSGGGDHSSSPAVARGVQRPTRGLRPGQPQTPPYLVLLRVGFSLPALSPGRRCALTAPFHPCHPGFRPEFGGVFSVALSLGSPPLAVNQHTALGVRTFLPGLTSAAATARPALRTLKLTGPAARAKSAPADVLRRVSLQPAGAIEGCSFTPFGRPPRSGSCCHRRGPRPSGGPSTDDVRGPAPFRSNGGCPARTRRSS